MQQKGKVLFIIHDLYQEDNYFPLGLGYMAAVLKKSDVEVLIYCQDLFHYTNDELAKFLEENEFDIIGVGFLAARFKETIESLCTVINEHKKNAWLFLGGPGPSPIPEYVLEKTKADIVVIGEAEETIVELLKCKLEKGDCSQIKGIAYRSPEGIMVNERRKPLAELDSLPFPEWSLFPMEKYIGCLKLYGADDKDVAFSIITSRGCVNRCSFCYRMEKGVRVRSLKNVVEEMKILNRTYGVNYFEIEDELFVLSKKRILEFRDVLNQESLKIKFYCQARVDLFDEEIAKAIEEAGCQFVNFGMESSDQNVLNLMNKNTTVEQNIKAAEIASKTGLGLGLNFIWGNIGDTEESLKGNVELIKKYNTYDQIRTIRPVTPYPGCDLYYEAIQKGLLTGPEDFFDKFKNSDLFTVNFTDIPEDKFYKLLFEANKELIIDHFSHTTKDMEEGNRLIKDFYNLYFKGGTNFRGARHYEKK